MNPIPPRLPGLLAAPVGPAVCGAGRTNVRRAGCRTSRSHGDRTGGSLTVPSATQAREQVEQTPGGAAVVNAEDHEQTRTVTIKDMLDYVPGVHAQPRHAEELRLSRTFHLRGIGLFQDGIPINLANGSGDFTGHRSPRLPVHRGLQGRQRPEARHCRARRRDPFRDTDPGATPIASSCA